MGANFSNFMFKHSIPATAASFAIGSASATMATTMASDIVIPILCAIVGFFRMRKIGPKFRLMPFANSVVVWLCVLFTTYILMEFVFARGMIGVSTVVLDGKEQETLNAARAKAAKPIQQAKQVVREAVSGFSSGPSFADYASISAATDHVTDATASMVQTTKPKTSVALQTTAPANFDGTM